MIKRWAAAAVMVMALAGLIKPGEADALGGKSEVSLDVFSRINNWLVDAKARPKSKSWEADLEFIKQTAASAEFKAGKHPELNDPHVTKLLNAIAKLSPDCTYSNVFLLRNTKAMILKQDQQAFNNWKKQRPLARILAFNAPNLQECYKLARGVLIDEIERDHITDESGPYWRDNISRALVRKKDSDEGKLPFGGKEVLDMLGEALGPGDSKMRHTIDEKTGEPLFMRLDDSQARKLIKKYMIKPCTKLVSWNSRLLKKIATIVSIADGAFLAHQKLTLYDSDSDKRVAKYISCNALLEMEDTDKLASDVVAARKLSNIALHMS